MSCDYGSAHMGCPIESSYRSATFTLMGTIGERIRQLRKAKGLTQPVLAKAIGIDQSTLSDMERGAGFSAEILMKLCDELEATADFIMRGRLTQPSPRVAAAQKAVSQLTDEERLSLFTAIQQPGLSDQGVERRIPITKAPPTAPAPAKKRAAARRS
jgi:transcriptional regulator with XRE-family HTH domain